MKWYKGQVEKWQPTAEQMEEGLNRIAELEELLASGQVGPTPQDAPECEVEEDPKPECDLSEIEQQWFVGNGSLLSYKEELHRLKSVYEA